MKKKITKLLSLTCVASMLVSSVAFAAAGEFSGDVAIENDNAEPLSYVNVVLPTLGESTYNFTIDIDGLLADYDKTLTYDASSNVYFNAQKTAATAVAKTGKLYKIVETVDTDLTKFKAEGFTADGSVVTAPDAFDEKYYVWQPDATTGKGKFTEVTLANYANFIDVTASEGVVSCTLKTHNVGTATDVFDGKLYYGAYTEVTGEELAKYVTTYDDAQEKVTAVETGVLYHSADTTAYTLVDNSNADTYITYTAEVRQMIGTSDIATIENKSAVPVAIKAAITVKNPASDYLKFVATTAELTGADASLYMAVQTGSNAVAVGNTADASGNKVANAYYILKGATSTPNKYQSTSTNGLTGGHTYYNYEAQDATYDSVDFTITAKANAATEADGSWDAYIEALTEEEVVKPEIDIVYTFETVTTTDNGATYTGADSVYTPAAGTSGIATAASKTVATSVAYTSQDPSTKAVKLTFTPGDAGKTLAKTSFKINGVELSGWTTYSTKVVFGNDNTITIDASTFASNSIVSATTDNKYTFTIVDTEGTAYSTTETVITFE